MYIFFEYIILYIGFIKTSWVLVPFYVYSKLIFITAIIFWLLLLTYYVILSKYVGFYKHWFVNKYINLSPKVVTVVLKFFILV